MKARTRRIAAVPAVATPNKPPHASGETKLDRLSGPSLRKLNAALQAEWWRYLRHRWLSEGRSARDFDRGGQELGDWLHSRGEADKARERRAWRRDHPGQTYPEHMCGISEREEAAYWRWRRKYGPRSRAAREFEQWRRSGGSA